MDLHIEPLYCIHDQAFFAMVVPFVSLQSLVCCPLTRGQPNVSCYDLLKLQGDNLGITQTHNLQTLANSEKIRKPTTHYGAGVMGYKLSLFGNKFLSNN